MPFDAAANPPRPMTQDELHAAVRVLAPGFVAVRTDGLDVFGAPETRQLVRRGDGAGYWMPPHQLRTSGGARYAPDGRVRALPPMVRPIESPAPLPTFACVTTPPSPPAGASLADALLHYLTWLAGHGGVLPRAAALADRLGGGWTAVRVSNAFRTLASRRDIRTWSGGAMSYRGERVVKLAAGARLATLGAPASVLP